MSCKNRDTLVSVLKLGAGLTLFAFALFSVVIADRFECLYRWIIPLFYSDARWIVLALIFLFFLFLNIGTAYERRQLTLARCFLMGCVFAGVLNYVLRSCPAIDAIVFLAGITVGQCIAALLISFNGMFSSGGAFFLRQPAFFCMALLLVMASLRRNTSEPLFKYYNIARAVGPWRDPDAFGLLVGSGFILTFGLLAIQMFTLFPKKSALRNAGAMKSGLFICLLLALGAVLLLSALFESYCRGAWFGVIVGATFLIFMVKGGCRSPKITVRQKIQDLHAAAGNFLVCVALMSIAVLGFWHFRGTHFIILHRMLSAVDQVDFSWRNRIASWVGAFQIIAEHPLTGAGWGKPQLLYKYYQMQPKIIEAGAFYSNDLLVLASALGIPAFFCLMACIISSLFGNSGTEREHGRHPEAWVLRIVFHSAALVLFVGFWFDGGLWKLPSATMFWTLLESGNEVARRSAATSIPIADSDKVPDDVADF